MMSDTWSTIIHLKYFVSLIKSKHGPNKLECCTILAWKGFPATNALVY